MLQYHLKAIRISAVITSILLLLFTIYITTMASRPLSFIDSDVWILTLGSATIVSVFLFTLNKNCTSSKLFAFVAFSALLYLVHSLIWAPGAVLDTLYYNRQLLIGDIDFGYLEFLRNPLLRMIYIILGNLTIFAFSFSKSWRAMASVPYGFALAFFLAGSTYSIFDSTDLRLESNFWNIFTLIYFSTIGMGIFWQLSRYYRATTDATTLSIMQKLTLSDV